MLQWLTRFDAFLIDRLVQPVLDRFELSPIPTARALLIAAVVMRIAASSVYFHLLGTLAWLMFLGQAIQTLSQQRSAARTPVGVFHRSGLLLVHAMLDPLLDLNLRGDAAFFAMLAAATAAFFYVLAGTPGTRRRVETRALRLSW